MRVGFLTEALSQGQRDIGLYLEQDDHNLFLMKENELLPVAVFSTHATLETILQEADQALGEIMNGVSFACTGTSEKGG